MIARRENHRGWLYGPAQDMIWGAGIGYGLVFGLLLAAGSGMTSVFPPWLLMFLVLFLSTPHYGATILRVYERREDRQSYAFFSTYSTLLLVLLLVWGVRDIVVGSVLFTVYLTWSPWHYTGQNYGITLMFLGRRGVEVGPRTKEMLRVSFVASFVVRFFYIHGPDSAYTFGDRVQFLSLNIPALAVDIALFVALLVYGASTFFVAFALLQKGLRQVGPALALVATQGVWFVVPSAVKNWVPYVGVPILTRSNEAYAVAWVALGHALQYLWICAYFAKKSGRADSVLAFSLKALMAGSAIWAVPLVLLSPQLFGSLPYDVGLVAVTAAVVNLHHFLLDGAIWKLRDSRIAHILVRRREEQRSTAAEPKRSAGLRWPLVATGLASLTLMLFGAAEEEFGLKRGLIDRDLELAERAITRLALIGRDSPFARAEVGSLAAQRGQLDRSLDHLKRGVRLYPTAPGWTRVGEVLAASGEKKSALEAFQNALALDPLDEVARMRLAITWAELGDTERARALFRASGSGVETLESLRLRYRLIEMLQS